MKKKYLILSLVSVFAITGCKSMEKESGKDAPVYSENIKSIKMVDWMTGPLSKVNTLEKWAVGGTDLGIPCYDETNHRMYFAFGDTYSGSYLDDAARSGNWRSNVIGYTTDLNASDGITLEGFITTEANPNFAKQIIGRYASDGIEVTNIPTGLIMVRDTMYMFHMSVRHWGAGGVWDCNYGGCYKSDDHGQNWSKIRDLIWTESDSANVQFVTELSKEAAKNRIAPNFMQIFPIDGKDGYIYLYGIPGGRLGGVKLMRVLPDNIETFLQYEYYVGLNDDGTPHFVKGDEGRLLAQEDSAYIVPPQVGEISIMFNKYLNKWMMIAIVGNKNIYVRYSDKPWGEWGQAKLLVSDKDFPLCYNGFMHERLTEENGKVVYFTMAQWNEYNVEVMRLEFE